MDILNVRQMLRQKNIYEIPLRVTFYARVSTDSNEQLNSLNNQVTYYENFIKQNSAWEYVPGYIDEGLSGISTRKRENFHRMVDDAKAGKFDLIVTKEISRFARNTLDSIQYTRDLLGAGVAVFFQNDGVNTLEEDCPLHYVQYDCQRQVQGLLCGQQGQSGGYVHQEAEIPPARRMGNVQG